MTESTKRYRFLVVEDEFMITMLLEDFLTDLGHELAGKAETIAEGIRIIETSLDIDAAILDMNIRGETVSPIVDALTERRIPFCFMTGYGAAVSTSHPQAPILGKPFDMNDLEATIDKLLTDGERA